MLRASAARRDVPTPVLGRLSLARVALVAMRVEPEVTEASARETLRRVVESTVRAELRTLRTAFGDAATDEGEGWRDVHVLGMSSETYVCVTPRKYAEATKMVCRATTSDEKIKEAKIPVRVTEVTTCEGKDQMDVLRSLVPTLVMQAFGEVPHWRAFGRTEYGTRFMYEDFFPSVPGGMTHAFGVEIEHGIKVTKAPATLAQDIGEDCEIEILFPSINAVALRLQRFGSVIDEMRQHGVATAKIRSFIDGAKVVEIHDTPIMAQAAPEIGVEVGIVAIRREVPRSCGFKSIAEFRIAFESSLGTFVPRHAHTDDSEEELLADICVPGCDKPFLWPVSLLLKSTGGTEFPARQSHVTNDHVLRFLEAARRVNIVDAHLSWLVRRSTFLARESAPTSGPVVPDRDIFVGASHNRSGWPAFSARANGMPDSLEMWVDPWPPNRNALPDSIFSPHDMVPPNFTSTPPSIPPTLKAPGESSDLFIGEDFDDIIDCAMDLSPSRIVANARKRMRVESSGDEAPPVLGSRVTQDGIQKSQFYSVPGAPPMKKRTTPTGRENLKNRIVAAYGVDNTEVSKRFLDVCLLIEADKLDQITVSRHHALDAAVIDARNLIKSVLKKYEDDENGKNFVERCGLVLTQIPKGRKKVELIDFLRSAFDLKIKTKTKL